ncbi:hypothetical protein Tco_0469178 [Tanacetum coccineum]
MPPSFWLQDENLACLKKLLSRNLLLIFYPGSMDARIFGATAGPAGVKEQEEVVALGQFLLLEETPEDRIDS